MSDLLNRYYSGVALNQNEAPEATDDFVTLAAMKYQQFRLPDDYLRDGATPDITGVQIFVGVDSLAASLAVSLQHKPFIGSWTTLAEGLASGAPVVDDEVWLTCLFESPVSVDGLEADNFRIKLTAVNGVTKVWYSVPNPLSARGGSKAFDSDGTTAITDASREVSFLFRLLSATADSGVDFLGNQYRSVVRRRAAALSGPTTSPDASWMSGPQPSKFAVVSQYFEVQDVNDDPVVVDRILIDPTTPGMWVHAYYCNDGEPADTTEDWEERVWTPVPRAHHAVQRDAFVLPEPIHARFIKLEYSHLQARSYSPGAFQRPITYRKHPKWVLDYFLLATEDARQAGAERFVARNVTVSFDAFDLAYRYYQDDLITGPDAPPFLSAEEKARVVSYLRTRDDLSDQLDSTMLAAVNFTLNPFLQDPRIANVARTLLGEVNASNVPTNPLVESLPADPRVRSLVATLNREAVVFEQTFPVMFFYLACRHRYRHVTAPLTHDRAYFAGVREIAFTRERYSVASDTALYVETMGDYQNADTNDFLNILVPEPPSLPAPTPGPVASFTYEIVP